MAKIYQLLFLSAAKIALLLMSTNAMSLLRQRKKAACLPSFQLASFHSEGETLEEGTLKWRRTP